MKTISIVYFQHSRGWYVHSFSNHGFALKPLEDYIHKIKQYLLVGLLKYIQL